MTVETPTVDQIAETENGKPGTGLIFVPGYARLYLEQSRINDEDTYYWDGYTHWFWDTNRFVPSSPDEALIRVQPWLFRNNFPAYPAYVENVVKSLRSFATKPRDYAAPQWVTVGEQQVHLPSGDTRAVTPGNGSYYALPYEYAPAAHCDRWLAWLGERFTHSPSSIQTIQDWFGYCLTPGNPLQVFLYVWGGGGTGKSTLLRVMQAVLGESNIDTMAFSGFVKDFGMDDLKFKLVNLADETDGAGPSTVKVLKKLTGGLKVSSARKYLGRIAFESRCKFVFASNDAPEYPDDSDGIWRRLILLDMRRKIPKGEMRESIVHELLAEAPGILNWAIEGWRRVHRDHRITFIAEALSFANELREEHRPQETFITTALRSESGVYLSNDDIRRGYLSWATDNGIKLEGTLGSLTHALSLQIRQNFPLAAKSKRQNRRGYVGLAWVPGYGGTEPVVPASEALETTRPSSGGPPQQRSQNDPHNNPQTQENSNDQA
jgi:P4 family phage/plasmid primase-like protien